MFLFYTPDIENCNTLSEEESAHCVRVLRYSVGDVIHTTDGKGGLYQAKIVTAHPKHCEVEVINKSIDENTHSFHLHIAIAPTKNIERLEWMVEKCTEIGVDEITPLLCSFSERKQLREDRLEKVVLSAAKQSLTTHFPVIHTLTDFTTFVTHIVRNAKENTQFLIAHCYATERHAMKEILVRGQNIVVLVGPEGDFSEEEVDLAISLGFLPISLGKSRLRTETAGVVACHTAILLNE